MNNILSMMLGVEDFFAATDLHSIIEKMKLFDIKIFKGHNIDSDKLGNSFAEDSHREIDNISNGKSLNNSDIFQVRSYSLRDIFLCTSKELDCL